MDIAADQMVFIDPEIAVGYDYSIGSGDPNFASVLLPDVGGGLFTVSFGATSVPVAAGVQYVFPAGGVPAFSVRGVSQATGLDPANVTAFITGVTFVENGRFTGTMTPITQPGNVRPLTLMASVNGPRFSPGERLEAAVGVSNTGTEGAADFFLGILTPDGRSIALFLATGGISLGDISDLSSFQPIAAGVPLAAPFSASVTKFFSSREAKRRFATR